LEKSPKITKSNSTNIKLCIVSGAPLEYMHVRLCTVPVPQDSCILPRGRDIGIPLSPGMNFVSLMRHTLWEADCGREALKAWSHLEVQEGATHQRRGQGREVVAMKTAWPRPSSLSLRSQATVLGQL